MEDPTQGRNYPANVRRNWYRHIKGHDPPELGSDQEWQSLLDTVIKGWKLTAEYMIAKQLAGNNMIEAERVFQNASTEAVTLPGDLYTERVSYDQAIVTARNLTELGNQWTIAANDYYRLNPLTPDARRGMTELIGNMEVIGDFDYDNVKTALQGDVNRAITIYRPDSNITIRSFPHLRDLDRENLVIFKEIYQNRTQQLPAPIVPLPVAPDRPAAPEAVSYTHLTLPTSDLV